MSSNSKPRHKSIFGSPVPSQSSDEDETTSSENAVSPISEDRQNEALDRLISVEEPEDRTLDLNDDEEEFDEEEDDHHRDKSPPFSSGNLKTWPQKRKWLAYTTKERADSGEIGELEARDLTNHILNTHGITAVQYGPQLGNIGEPGYSFENTIIDRFNSRAQWVADWTPRVYWTRWPLRPTTVPRKQQQVWATSFTKSETWKPSRELEQCLFAFVLRTARTQWTARDDSNGEPPAKKLKVEMNHDSAESTDGYATEAEPTGTEEKKHALKTYYHEIQPDPPVLSADDERSWRLLKPVVGSTISTLDKVLAVIYKSQKGSKENYGRDPSKRQNNRSPVDWSHILGLAAVAGVSSTAISRAATRCSAALNESMAFNLLCEEEASPKVGPPTIYSPNDLHLHNPDARLIESISDWNLEKGCPFKDCNWYGRRYWNKGSETNYGPLQEHLRRTHKWYMGRPSELDENLTGMSGGVHVDGFMQPIVPGVGWRARDRKQRKHPGSRRSQQTGPSEDQAGPSKVPDMDSDL
jgi:hypothetical protein